MEPRISIITLGVADLARSVRFYRDGLGLPLREGSGDEIAFFETRGTWLALFPRQALAEDAAVSADGAGFPGFTLAHNVRSRAEVDALLGKPRRTAPGSSSPRRTRTGEAIPDTSRIRMAISGRLPGTRTSGSSERAPG
jgi:catechol 2,3-dioxygenase-like lactoylglutathione lyase family enzyme